VGAGHESEDTHVELMFGGSQSSVVLDSIQLRLLEIELNSRRKKSVRNSLTLSIHFFRPQIF